MLSIVPATLEHAKILFEWRNDPLTRAMSRNHAPVKWSEHLAWLTARLDRLEPHLYIAKFKDHPIGTFRIDGDEISYTVAPDARNQGLGFAMLCKAREMFGPLRAEIYVRNIASIRIAERAGMHVRVIIPAIKH